MEKETLTEKKKCNAEQENEYILNVFKYYVFCNSLLIFIIHFQCSTMSYLMMLLLFLFYRRIALQSISYMVKTFAAKMLVAKMFTAEELMPKAILIENVPRLLTDYRLKVFTNQLKKLGYHVESGVLDAQYFGTPQRRKRMILIACRLGRIPLPPPNNQRLTVYDAIGHLPPADSAHNIPLHNMRQKLSPLVQDRVNHIKHNRSELPENLVLKCHKKYSNGFRDVYGRMSWNEVSPTITRCSHNPSKGRFIHPEENRGLTLYESLLLQGFPKDYEFRAELGIGRISSMIGEAVPPPMAAAHGLHIKRMLSILGQLTD